MTDHTGTLVSLTDGTAVTTSLVIAEGTSSHHRAVIQLVRNNLADFEEFGGVAFEMRPFDTAGGLQERTVAVLNEQHATLLMTYLRNTDVVREFKKRLVKAFYTLASAQTAPALPTDRTELLARAVLEADQMIREKDDEIAELTPKAEYVDTFVADEDMLSFRTVASTLNIGEQELRELLIDRGWIKRETTTRWSEKRGKKVAVNRYVEYAHKKPYFFRREDHDAPRFRGEVMHTLKITASGAAAVARLVKRGDNGPDLKAVAS